MKNYLNQLDAESLRILRHVGAQAQEAGARAYVVGGCVRDLILRRKVLDLDVTIEGDAILAARAFCRAYHGRLTEYAAFGTATVVLSNGRAIDFAFARRENYPHPGALPAVEEGDIGEDLFRRDFTINAIAIAIDPRHFGCLVDHYGGFDDLKKKYIRVMHDRSFMDDPTRILRAVRFEQRFRFRIEPITLGLLHQALKKKAPATVKPQRYFEEFKKNLKEPKALENVQRLADLKALNFLRAGLALERRQLRLLRKVSGVLRWADKNLMDWPSSNGWLVYVMGMFDGMAPVFVQKTLGNFSVANIDKKKIMGSLFSKNILAQLPLSVREAFEAMRPLSIEELLWLQANASSVLARARIRKHLLKWRHLKLQINGDDLQRLGIPSGKAFKMILDEVLGALVEGRCSSKSEQLACAQKLIQQHQ